MLRIVLPSSPAIPSSILARTATVDSTNIHADRAVRIYKCADCQKLTWDD